MKKFLVVKSYVIFFKKFKENSLRCKCSGGKVMFIKKKFCFSIRNNFSLNSKSLIFKIKKVIEEVLESRKGELTVFFFKTLTYRTNSGSSSNYPKMELPLF